MLSSVWSLMLPVLIRVKQQVVGWASNVFTSRILLYCVGLSLDCLCLYQCNMIVGEGMCHFDGCV